MTDYLGSLDLLMRRYGGSALLHPAAVCFGWMCPLVQETQQDSQPPADGLLRVCAGAVLEGSEVVFQTRIMNEHLICSLCNPPFPTPPPSQPDTAMLPRRLIGKDLGVGFSRGGIQR